MRWRATLLIGLIAALPVSAEDWTTADGKTYRNVTIVAQQDDGVRITYTGGAGIIPYYELPLDVQKRMGVDFDSLEAKRRAAQQAADEAARNAATAAAAADAALAAEAKAHPDAVPGATAVPGASAVPGAAAQPGAANQVAPGSTITPGVATQATPGSAITPGAANQATPGSAITPGTSPAGATASTTTSPAGTAPSGSAPAGSAAAAAAAAPAGGAPAGSSPAAGLPASGAPADANAAATSSTATAATGNAPPAAPVNPYPGASYRYDDTLDVCYLASPTVAVTLISPDATKNGPASQGTLALRTETDGQKPAAPDEVEAIFHSDGPPETAPVAHHIKFLADGTYFPATEKTAEDGGASSDGIPFYLTPIQARAIFAGHNVNFNVGKNNYRVDDAGIATFHKYVDTIAQLPAAAPSLSRMFHKFVANLPPISTMVSTVCEYVVVGGAGLVVLISLAMVAIGTRAVIKW